MDPKLTLESDFWRAFRRLQLATRNPVSTTQDLSRLWTTARIAFARWRGEDLEPLEVERVVIPMASDSGCA